MRPDLFQNYAMPEPDTLFLPDPSRPIQGHLSAVTVPNLKGPAIAEAQPGWASADHQAKETEARTQQLAIGR